MEEKIKQGRLKDAAALALTINQDSQTPPNMDYWEERLLLSFDSPLEQTRAILALTLQTQWHGYVYVSMDQTDQGLTFVHYYLSGEQISTDELREVVDQSDLPYEEPRIENDHVRDILRKGLHLTAAGSQAQAIATIQIMLDRHCDRFGGSITGQVVLEFLTEGTDTTSAELARNRALVKLTLQTTYPGYALPGETNTQLIFMMVDTPTEEQPSKQQLWEVLNEIGPLTFSGTSAFDPNHLFPPPGGTRVILDGGDIL